MSDCCEQRPLEADDGALLLLGGTSLLLLLFGCLWYLSMLFGALALTGIKKAHIAYVDLALQQMCIKAVSHPVRDAVEDAFNKWGVFKRRKDAMGLNNQARGYMY